LIDKYGIKQFYPSTGREWFNTWDNNKPRTILSKGTDKRNKDPYDKFSDLHCKSGDNGITTKAIIDGKGICTLYGTTPRLYNNDPERKLKWFNVEMTVYFYIVKKLPKGGAYVACRLCGRSNHQNEYNCSASGTGYSYETKNSNGTNQLRKELGHPAYADDVKSETKGVEAGIWIGHKLIVKTLPDSDYVLVQGYRDLTDGKDGGDWKLMVENIDKGNWKMTREEDLKSFKKIKSCKSFKKMSSTKAILDKPAISCYLRIDSNEVRFKKYSIREI